MTTEPHGNYLACIYSMEDTHMPAIIFAGLNEEGKVDVHMECVFYEYVTADAHAAYNQAQQDYTDINNATKSIEDLNNRVDRFLRMLKERGYFPTPTSLQKMLEHDHRQSMH